MKKILSILLFALSFSASAQELDPSIYRNAMEGDPYAQSLVGWRYAMDGKDEEALRWLRVALESGYTDACPTVMEILRRNGWQPGEFANLCMIGGNPRVTNE